MKLLIAIAVQSGEERRVSKVVFGLVTLNNIGTEVMVSATFICIAKFSEIIFVVCYVSSSTPFCALKVN
jgi:hypothetical protein